MTKQSDSDKIKLCHKLRDKQLDDLGARIIKHQNEIQALDKKRTQAIEHCNKEIAKIRQAR